MFAHPSPWQRAGFDCARDVAVTRQQSRGERPKKENVSRATIAGHDVFGLAFAPWFLRATCSILSSGISEFAVNVCSPDTNKNANKADGWGELFTCIFNAPSKFS
jgi:hypothetical protein